MSLLAKFASSNDEIVVYTYRDFVVYGSDDKASNHVSHDAHIVAISQHSKNAIVCVGYSIGSKDHDWYAEKIILSMNHFMNIGESVNDSLYIGGMNVHGQPEVTIHYVTLQKSTGF